MSTALQRGIVLYQQGRHDLADVEFRRALSEDPDDPQAHAFLALCLTRLDRDDEAIREANEAVRQDPGWAFAHYALGVSLQGLGRYREAEAAANQAIQLDPDDADFRGLLAGIEMGRRRWPEALAASEAGLALDPTHEFCLNLRGMALVQLGRKDEAADALGSALAEGPDNALTHANQGWALLHRGDAARALEHFREALRLDPTLEWARVGIVEALKARHLFYRTLLRFFLWLGRQSSRAQWALMLGFVFGRVILINLAQNYPSLAPFITPIIALSVGFVLLTFIASPLFNFLLQFNRFGRLALSRDERLAANLIGPCFAIASALFLANLVRGTPLTLIGMVYFGLMLLPLAVTFSRPPGRPRWLMTAYTVGLALLPIPALSILLLGDASPFRDPRRAVELLDFFKIGVVVSTWLPAVLGLRAESR